MFKNESDQKIKLIEIYPNKKIKIDQITRFSESLDLGGFLIKINNMIEIQKKNKNVHPVKKA